MNKWFTFRQNNSGGWLGNPAVNVVVQAESLEKACDIAEEYGVYFRGAVLGYDCECCGDRWYASADENDTLSEACASVDNYWGKSEGIPAVLIVTKDRVAVSIRDTDRLAAEIELLEGSA